MGNIVKAFLQIIGKGDYKLNIIFRQVNIPIKYFILNIFIKMTI